MQCLISHPVDVAAAALGHQPLHDHVHTTLAVRAPDTAAEGERVRDLITLAPTPGPGLSPALPGLPFDFSEIAHTDCHKDARVEVPCHLEAGMIGLWSAGG